MALDFPNAPTDGLVYTAPTGEQWVYEAATNSWTSKGLVNNSGGLKYVGTIDITAAPPTGATGGAMYTVQADGTANAGFGPGITGALTKGDSVLNTGAGWIKLSHPTAAWLRTGTSLAPTNTGDVVNVSAGTAALPGLTPVGDPNTGLWSPGADQVAVSTNGVERLRVGATGNLGIGTSSPSQPLTVNGNVLITGDVRALSFTSANGSNPYYMTANISDTLDGGLRLGAGARGTTPANTQIKLGGNGTTNLGVSDGTIGALVRLQPSTGTALSVIGSTGLLKMTATDSSAVGAENWEFNAKTYKFSISDTGVFHIKDATVGIGAGTATPTAALQVKAGTTGAATIPLIVQGPTSEFARIDASGRLLVGASTAVVGSAAKLQTATTINAVTAVYADNTAAKAGGLVAGDIYRKADGTLMITF